METNDRQLATKLKEFRERAGLNQTEVAMKLGFTQSAVNQYENGKRTPNFETLVKLAEIYGCTINDFV
jgi:transcriptional regulator with XRE-family HTH domain